MSSWESLGRLAFVLVFLWLFVNSYCVRIERYLLVLRVPFRRLTKERCATEGAFTIHLKELRDTLVPGAQIRVLAPEMSAETYVQNRDYFSELEVGADRIEYVPLYPDDVGIGEFWRRGPTMLEQIREHVAWCDVLQSGPSHQVTRPFEFAALIEAMRTGKKTIAVMDIDLRREAEMNYQVGNIPFRALLTNRYFHDPLRKAQLHVVAQKCSLVLFKGQDMVDDFGRGRSAVKNILDASHGEENLISRSSLEAKRRAILRPERPLQLVYFGRLVPYKGVDRMLKAVKIARQRGARIEFEVIGPGPERDRLESLTQQLGIEDVVSFSGPIPFGKPLFEKLYKKHLLLAAPLTEDTPRSALDALAAGIPILGFDTQYYRSLRESRAVALCRWPEPESMASRIVDLERDRTRLASMLDPAVGYAQDNTQEKWIRRRAHWTEQFVGQVRPLQMLAANPS